MPYIECSLSRPTGESSERLCPGVSAIVLAGGLGTRLRSVVSDVPKVLAPACGRPFLLWVLERLVNQGISQLVLCVGYGAELVRAAVGNSYRGVPVVYSEEKVLCGTGGALSLAAPLVTSPLAIVVNGDTLFEGRLAPAVAFHQTRSACVTLCLAQVQDLSRYGSVECSESGAVLSFVEKGECHGAGWINAGAYIVNRTFLYSLPLGVLSFERDILGRWVGPGLFAVRQSGAFLDIGIPADYARIEAFLEHHLSAA